MIFGLGALVALYVVTAAVLLALCLFSRWIPGAKIPLIALVSAAYVAVYFGLPTRSGWPADRPLPKRFTLYAVLVRAADPETGARGEIFFWAADRAPGHAPIACPSRPRSRRSSLPPAASCARTFRQVGEIEDEETRLSACRHSTLSAAGRA